MRYSSWHAGWRCFRSTRLVDFGREDEEEAAEAGRRSPAFGRLTRQELRSFSLRRQAAGCQRLHLQNERFRRGNDGAADLPLR